MNIINTTFSDNSLTTISASTIHEFKLTDSLIKDSTGLESGGIYCFDCRSVIIDTCRFENLTSDI